MRKMPGQKRKGGSCEKRAQKFDAEKRKEGYEEKRVALLLYFCNYRSMSKPDPIVVARSADRFAALGAEPRLQIIRLLLSAHPTGMNVGEIQEELEIPASTLSHHLEKLKQVGLVTVHRAGTFLWYSASTAALQEVLGFLYEECCTRNRVVPAEAIVQIAK
jgi:ArsR family transcriptional regulator, arsenate/arsenite/antimonite-responsive transcriptional repressor